MLLRTSALAQFGQDAPRFDTSTSFWATNGSLQTAHWKSSAISNRFRSVS